MTDPRSSAAATKSRRRSRPAAASRILVNGFSVTATLGLAAAMATTDVPYVQPSSIQIADNTTGVPAAVTVSATNQPAVTTSDAS